MPRRIQAEWTRRPQPRWFQIFLSTAVVLGLIYFFASDLLGELVQRARRGELPEVQMVTVSFGDSDGGAEDGYQCYYRYELVPVSIAVQDATGEPIAVNEPRVRVFREGIHVRDAGGRAQVPVRYDPASNAWVGKWPMPLGTEPAVYTVRCELSVPVEAYPSNYDWRSRSAPSRQREGRSKRLELVTEDTESEPRAREEAVDQSAYRPAPGSLVREVIDRDFRVVAREPREVPRGLGIVTYETAMTNVLELRTRRPNGEEGDWTAIFDWLDLFSADTLWYSAFVTDTRGGPLPSGSVWFGPTRRALDAMGAHAHSRGLTFGAYAYAYRTFGDPKLLPPYRMVQANDHAEAYIPSLLDLGRVHDLTGMVREMDANPNVDMIGFDYIRDGNVGFATVNEFVDEMRPDVPEDWNELGAEDREAWIRERSAAWSSETARLWDWWRAHRTALVLRDILRDSGCEKPLWTFTLSWLHGQQHGQDPYMFTDAGVAIDAVMLYEYNSQRQFDAVVPGIRKTKQEGSWSVYSEASPMNLIFGNQIDFYSHQGITSPPAPQRYYERLLTAMQETDHHQPPVGVFCHDVMRAISGRTGPYAGREWALAGAAAMTRCREMNSRVPARVELLLPGSDGFAIGSSVRGTVKLTAIHDRPVEILGVTTYDTPGVSGRQDIYERPAVLQPGDTVEVPAEWYISGIRPGGPSHAMLAARVHWGSPEHAPSSTVYTYAGVY